MRARPPELGELLVIPRPDGSKQRSIVVRTEEPAYPGGRWKVWLAVDPEDELGRE